MAAIETFATTGAYEAAKKRGQQAVGVSNVTDCLRPHRGGRLEVVAVAVQQGRTLQLWQVDVRRIEDDKLVARGHVCLQNVEPRAPASSPRPSRPASSAPARAGSGRVLRAVGVVLAAAPSERCSMRTPGQPSTVGDLIDERGRMGGADRTATVITGLGRPPLTLSR
jgi:hypothetical protein